MAYAVGVGRVLDGDAPDVQGGGAGDHDEEPDDPVSRAPVTTSMRR
jgi:hypothetical protein